MVSFEQERARAEELLLRLRLDLSTPVINPNEQGKPDKGVDCVANLKDGRKIGIQVTELDPWSAPGTRGDERRLAADGQYGMFAQNSPDIVLGAIRCTIERKVKIAASHEFDWLSEVWLLVCTGIPESPVATFAPTGALRPEDIERRSAEILRESKYHWCFLLPLLGIEKAFYQRQRGRVWEKSVELSDISQQPRGRYVQDLIAACDAGEVEEFDRLTRQEVKRALRDVRCK